MKLPIKEIAQLIDADIEGNQDLYILGPGRIEDASEGDICFLANAKYENNLYSTKCSCIILHKNQEVLHKIPQTLLRVDNVYEAFGKVLHLFDKSIENVEGISPNAFIHASARVGKKVNIGHFTIINSNAVIGDGSNIFGQVFIGDEVEIGKNVTIYAGCKIFSRVKIGDNSIIHANAVIGSDGFGFSQNDHGNYNKIPQVGSVIIEQNVEIGACTTIDRATMGNTIIKSGVKLDNLIQIGHNVQIDHNSAIAAQTGVSGSTKIGKNCIIGGQVGFAGHIEIADGTMIQAKSGIGSNIKEANKKFYGYPALPYQDYLKSYAYFRKFPDIVDKIRDLEKEIDILRRQVNKNNID